MILAAIDTWFRHAITGCLVVGAILLVAGATLLVVGMVERWRDGGWKK